MGLYVQSPPKYSGASRSIGVTTVKRSIFYLDDEISQLEVFQDMFGDDYDMRTASTLDAARRMLADRCADIIISDQLMPDIAGTKFLAEAGRSCPHSFRVLLTGHGVVGDVIPEISTGIFHLFITKPWTEEEMREAFERAEIFLNPSRKSRRRRRKNGKADNTGSDSDSN